MRPLSLKGHERALTRVRFNREGDLLFSAAKDKKPCVWYTENGERIGSYDGHNGAVWDIDVSWDTSSLVSAAADNSVKLWDCEKGVCLATINTPTPAKSCNFSYSGNLISYTTLKMTKNLSTLQVRDIRDPAQMSEANEPAFCAQFDVSANTSIFSNLDEEVTIGFESGLMLQYDLRNSSTHKNANENTHRYSIQDLQLAPNMLFIVSASRDKTAALLDVNNLNRLKQYKSERPVNSACASPNRDHICLGGGEDAMTVTQTSVSAGHFEAKIYHMVFEEEFARFKGHFGPINSMAWHPAGDIIATGGEDGYVRVQEFDNDYSEFKYDF
ncbi:unnamed protein product [Caenorhabditis auriculariae]|uniref:Eukaryotic translation initiation factor 3 subunit I n=1 Tax=Caenorhabditis auriculariae TaxID=2777116 RepID=A0A8S1H4U5_9PELO|nr:unnamed protein product [Caenorhabditis auriculariae]